jgi:hypothetical protein
MMLEPYDVELLVEALAHRAGRLESMAARNRFGRNNDEKAGDMRRLRTRIIELRPRTIVANNS